MQFCDFGHLNANATLRGNLLTNFQRYWSIQISLESNAPRDWSTWIFPWNSYEPMTPKSPRNFWSTQRKTKEQSRHFFTLFGTFPQSFSEFFLQEFFLELRGFTTVFVQRDEKRRKEKTKKKRRESCTFVLLQSTLALVHRLLFSTFCANPPALSLSKNSGVSLDTIKTGQSTEDRYWYWEGF